jgi:hypothetical protein
MPKSRIIIRSIYNYVCPSLFTIKHADKIIDLKSFSPSLLLFYSNEYNKYLRLSEDYYLLCQFTNSEAQLEQKSTAQGSAGQLSTVDYSTEM